MELKIDFTDLCLLYRSLSYLDFDCLASSFDSPDNCTSDQIKEWDKLSLLFRVVNLLNEMRPLPF